MRKQYFMKNRIKSKHASTYKKSDPIVQNQTSFWSYWVLKNLNS